VFGFVVGLAAEARIAARFGFPVQAGGGTPEGAEAAATRLVGQGATALVSFGLAGGLDPALRPGAVIIPSVVLADGVARHADALLAQRFGGLTVHTILAGSAVAVGAAEKRRLHAATQAHAIDLESGAVATIAAKHGLPFIVVRAICDPAERDLPPAALIALNPDGGIGLWGVLQSVAAQPRQIPDLLALARDAAQARRALIQVAERFQAAAGPSGR
jgi:adenosylhomocysteine nucleosidase